MRSFEGGENQPRSMRSVGFSVTMKISSTNDHRLCEELLI